MFPLLFCLTENIQITAPKTKSYEPLKNLRHVNMVNWKEIIACEEFSSCIVL